MENREYEINSSQINFNLKGSLFETTQNFRPSLNNRVPIFRLDEINDNKSENNFEEDRRKNGVPSYYMEEEDVNLKENNSSSNKASINKQSSLSDLMSQKQQIE